MKLRPGDKRAIEQHIAEFERASGVQAVVSVVARCDSYPEIPWRAFALGVAVAALFVCLVPFAGALLFHSTVLALVTVLAAGAAPALLSVLAPVTGRWLLPASRADAELRQYAQAQFLERGLPAVAEGRAILILLALFERRGAVVADSRLFAAPEPVRNAESLLNAMLAAADAAAAVKGALGSLRSALPPASGPSGNALPDSVVEERGA
jgi:putative membrane protein